MAGEIYLQDFWNFLGSLSQIACNSESAPGRVASGPRHQRAESNMDVTESENESVTGSEFEGSWRGP